jgi:hypothetical protein
MRSLKREYTKRMSWRSKNALIALERLARGVAGLMLAHRLMNS